jgi:hypothetical protein
MHLAFAPLIVVLAASGPDELARVHALGDHDELARLGGQAGAGGIAPMLDDADPRVVRAGIAAAEAAPDAWELLAPLAKVAGAWDRSLAAPAAHAAARIARTLDTDVAINLELPDDALEARQHLWSAIARRADRWADVRVHALEVTSTLAQARRATAATDPGLGYDLAGLLGDPDGEVRRAACELVPQPAPASTHATLAATIQHDADDAVAIACAQALCAGLRWDPATPIVVALGDEGATRLRKIAGGPLPDVPAGALVDAARCLAAHGRREDLAALRSMASRAPRQVRAMILRAEKLNR